MTFQRRRMWWSESSQDTRSESERVRIRGRGRGRRCTKPVRGCVGDETKQSQEK